MRGAVGSSGVRRARDQSGTGLAHRQTLLRVPIDRRRLCVLGRRPAAVPHRLPRLDGSIRSDGSTSHSDTIRWKMTSVSPSGDDGVRGARSRLLHLGLLFDWRLLFDLGLLLDRDWAHGSSAGAPLLGGLLA